MMLYLLYYIAFAICYALLYLLISINHISAHMCKSEPLHHGHHGEGQPQLLTLTPTFYLLIISYLTYLCYV
jgi:hypothetical protein